MNGMARTILSAGFAVLLLAGAVSGAEREVSFETADGWKLSGMLGMPEGASGRVPAVIFLHSYEHDQDTYGQYLYPGLAQIIGAKGVATLRFDFRGRGKSEGSRKMHEFSAEELGKLHMDVEAAIRFLRRQQDIDGERIGIVAESISAEAAIRGWKGDRGVPGLVLISGRLNEDARLQISRHPKTPLYLVVSKEDRESLRDMARAYALTSSRHSRIDVHQNMGMGTTMFSVWRTERQKDRPIEEVLAEWMVSRLDEAGEREEVTFRSEDGWTLHGTLRKPGRLPPDAEVNGVVFVHSSFTDRRIFDHLARLAVERGMVALTFDTRGRGKSTGGGRFIDLPLEERERGPLDIKAAMNFLASRVKVARIALVGTDRGANFALAAAAGESRVGALVIMTTMLSPAQRDRIGQMDIPFFYLASREIEVATRAMADAYAVSRHRGSRFVVYDGGTLGYEIFHLDRTLEPTLANWLNDQLRK